MEDGGLETGKKKTGDGDGDRRKGDKGKRNEGKEMVAGGRGLAHQLDSVADQVILGAVQAPVGGAAVKGK